MSSEYEIVGWKEHGDGKRTKGALAWVALDTDQGIGYCKLVAKHGPAGWGVWCSLLMEGARRSQEKRGRLPGSLEDLALLTRFTEEQLAPVIETLKAIGWLSGGDLVESPETPRESPEKSRLHTDIQTDTTDRQDTTKSATAKPPTPLAVDLAQNLYDAICSHTPDFKADEKKLLGWARTFDVELRKKGGYTALQMRGVISWAHRLDPEGFWHSNLLSATKVRKHMAKLLIRANQTGRGRGMSVKDLLSDDIDFPEVIR